MIGRSLFLKRTLLVFWAIWQTVVFATNLVDAGKVAGLLPASWTFASGNYGFVVETTARYGTQAWLNALLFAGVLGWEAAAAVLFWLACCCFRGRRRPGASLVYSAFTTSLGLWGAFMIADEICIAYSVEAAHVRLLTAQLATLLVLELLPEDAPGVGQWT